MLVFFLLVLPLFFLRRFHVVFFSLFLSSRTQAFAAAATAGYVVGDSRNTRLSVASCWLQ